MKSYLNSKTFRYPEPTGWAQTEDGVDLPFYIGGDGPTLLMLNGFTCNQANLAKLRVLFEKKYTVVSFDYRGHGLSRGPVNESFIHLDTLMSDIDAVLRAAQAVPDAMLGYSMGGQLMLEYAARNGESLAAKALIALNPTTGKVFDTFMNLSVLSDVFATVYAYYPKYFDYLSKIWQTLLGLPYPIKYLGAAAVLLDPRHCDPEDIKPFINQLQYIDMHVIMRMSNIMHENTVLPDLPKIQQPVLYISGTKDNFAPPNVSREAAARTPVSELALIEGGTHNMNLEKPEEVVRIAEIFMEKYI